MSRQRLISRHALAWAGCVALSIGQPAYGYTLENRIEQALREFRASEQQEGATVLPDGTAVDRAAWSGNIVDIDLTIPFGPKGAELPMSIVEALTEHFARAIDPGEA